MSISNLSVTVRFLCVYFCLLKVNFFYWKLKQNKMVLSCAGPRVGLVGPLQLKILCEKINLSMCIVSFNCCHNGSRNMNNRGTQRTSVTMNYNHKTYLIKNYLKRFIYYVDFICYRQKLLKCLNRSQVSSRKISLMMLQ